MVRRQIARRGVADPRVLEAMATVPRERFVAPDLARWAYGDGPLPIPEGQTVSQPYVVARMVEALELSAGDRVLEVGTGCGYAAAVLACLAGAVFTVERHISLATEAQGRLSELGFRNVQVRHGDGTEGWPEHAPYDAVAVAAGGPRVPPALRDQLRPGGRLVIPVGRPEAQRLVRERRGPDGAFAREVLGRVRFVPLVGAGGWPDEAAGARAGATGVRAVPEDAGSLGALPFRHPVQD